MWRDFYDVYEIMTICAADVDKALLSKAFCATCKRRKTLFLREEMLHILNMIEKDAGMAAMWERFREKNYFVGDLEWNNVLRGVLDVIYTYIDIQVC